MHDRHTTAIIAQPKETPVLNSMNQKAVSNNAAASVGGGGLEKGKPHAGMIGSLEIEINTTSNILSAMQNRLTELERFV